MTSSWLLKKRKEMKKYWDESNFGNPNNSLGGWEDHYIINGAVRECRSGFQAVPIGNSSGFMICRRMKYSDGKSVDDVHKPIDPAQFNGYNKYMADMYRPWKKTQIQITNPYNYYDRTAPNEEYLHRRDYLAREIKYNSIGVNPTRTPGPRKYHEYGYSYTKNPPYKYDVQRLHQTYPLWKDDKIYHGASINEMDTFDRNYQPVANLNMNGTFRSINKEKVTMGTW